MRWVLVFLVSITALAEEEEMSSPLYESNMSPWVLPENHRSEEVESDFGDVLRCVDAIQYNGEQTKDGHMILHLVRTQCRWEPLDRKSLR